MVFGNISRGLDIDPDSVSREEAKEISREVADFMDYIIEEYDLDVMNERASENIGVEP